MLKLCSQNGINKVAVFSDIHSNYLALKACFEDAKQEGANAFVFLGDYVSGLADAVKTLDLVYEIQSDFPTVCIRGNRERYMLDHRNGNAPLKHNLHDGSYLYTYKQLRENDFAFIENIPFYDRVEISGVIFELAHATKESDRYFFEQDDAYISEVFEQMSALYMLTGHTHKPYIKTQGNKTIINAGSVGLPQDTDGLAQYVLLEIKNGAVFCEFRNVAYDYEKLIHAQFESGLVTFAKYWAISDLYNALTGKGYTKMLLERVYAHSQGDDSKLNDEEMWHRFAVELKMCMKEDEIIALIDKKDI